MRRWKLVTAHAVVVVVLTVAVVVFAAVTDVRSNDPNIGFGLLLLPLFALGLPWSLLYVFEPFRLGGAPDLVRFAVASAPALLNVVLHAVVTRWWRRRRATSPGRAGGTPPARR